MNGSEVFRDPVAKAGEIMEMLSDIAVGEYEESEKSGSAEF